MNLAVTCFSRSWGGLEMKLVQLAKGLKDRGHTILVVAPPHSPIAYSCETQALPFSGVSPFLRYLDVPSALHLAGLFRRKSISVIVAGLSRDLSTLVLAKRFSGQIRLVFFQQMQFGLKKKGAFHRWTFGGVDRWLTLTRAMRSSVLENTHVAPGRISVFAPGADLAKFDPRNHQRGVSRHTFGLPPGKRILGVVGRLDPQKGQDILLRALPAIRNSFADIHVVFAGDETKGEEGFKGRLTTMAHDLGVSNDVTFLPHTDNVPGFLSAIDIFVLPSLNETYGYVVPEAMAMAKPIVATAAGGIPEIISDGQNGVLVRPSDAEDLAEKIITLLSTPSLTASLSAQARATAEQHHDFGNSVEVLESILLEEEESVRAG
ncbi:MAG: glycosyltransferase family 4 protein, partial [Bacteroidota bacterium]